MLHNSAQVLEELKLAPPDWRFTPTNLKRPYLKGWQNIFLTLEEVIEHNGTGVGVHLGKVTKTVAFDFDPENLSIDELKKHFRNHFGRDISELPKSISWTSGKLGRFQLAMKVPEEYLEIVEHIEDKPELPEMEIRWNKHQSVLIGKHPETGSYKWINPPSSTPLAFTPEWFLLGWLKLSQKYSKPKQEPKQESFISEKAKQRSKEDLWNDASRVPIYLEKWLQPNKNYNYNKHSDWIKVGMSLHYLSWEFGDKDKFFKAWIDWSKKLDNYDYPTCKRKWNSFTTDGAKIESGTFFDMGEGHPNHPNHEAWKIRHPELVQEDEEQKNKTWKYTELREAIYKALEKGDENEYQSLLSDLWKFFHKTSRDIRGELMSLMTREITGATPKPKLISMRKIKKLNYLLYGYLLEGEVHEFYGDWGSGKTSLTLGVLRAVIKGTGFLQYSIPLPPKKVLYIQTDAGAGRFDAAYSELGLHDEPLLQEEAENLFVSAGDIEQNSGYWGASIEGLNQLVKWIKELQVKVVVIDSLKGMCSNSGLEYRDNVHAKETMRYLLTIAQTFSVAIVLINHTGTAEGESSGAKAWSESAAYVLKVQTVKDKRKQVVKGRRELIIKKDPLEGKSSLHYKLDQETMHHIPCDLQDIIISKTDVVKKFITDKNRNEGQTIFKTKDLLEQLYKEDVSESSLFRALRELSKFSGIIRRKTNGVWEVKKPL